MDKKIFETTGTTQFVKVQVEDLRILGESSELYDYSKKREIFKVLEEQVVNGRPMSPIITYMLPEGQIGVIDGVKRVMTFKKKGIKETEVLLMDFTPSNSKELKNEMIRFNIRPELTNTEKKNVILHLLESDLKYQEKINEITVLLGRGCGTNNAKTLGKVIKFEVANPDNKLNLSENIFNGTLSYALANKILEIFSSKKLNYTIDQENKAGILKLVSEKKISYDNSVKLIKTHNQKVNGDFTSILPNSKVDSEVYEIIKGDCKNVKFRRDTKIDMVFTSVPYYMQVLYGDDENEIGREKTKEDYVNNLLQVIKNPLDSLSDTGVICININETYQNGQCLGVVPLLILKVIEMLGLIFVDQVIWEKPNNKPNPNSIKRFTSSYEYILIFAKSKNYYYNPLKFYDPNKTAKATRNCKEQVVKIEQENRKLKDKEQKNKYHISNPYQTIRTFLSEQKFRNILTLNISGDRSQKKVEGTDFFGSFPTLLPIPFLLSYMPEGGTVYDPFGGTGTTGKAAILLNRKVILSELYEENISTIREVLEMGIREYNGNDCNELATCFEDEGLLPAA